MRPLTEIYTSCTAVEPRPWRVQPTPSVTRENFNKAYSKNRETKIAVAPFSLAAVRILTFPPMGDASVRTRLSDTMLSL